MKMIHVVSLCLSQSIVLARHHQSVLSQSPIQVYWTSVWCRTTRQAVAHPHLPAIAQNYSPPYSTKWKVFHPAFQASTYWKRGLRIARCPQGSCGIWGNGSGGPSGRWSWNIQKNWFVAHFLGLKRWECFFNVTGCWIKLLHQPQNQKGYWFRFAQTPREGSWLKK